MKPGVAACILAVGDAAESSTFSHRIAAMRRLGHHVDIWDPRHALGRALASRWKLALHYRTGYLLLQACVQKAMDALAVQSTSKYDVAWVNGGEWLGRKAVRRLRGFANRVVLYNNDDPTGTRDGNRWLSLHRAIPEYDLCTVLRKINVQEYRAAGARDVLRVWMSYDEIAHRALEMDERKPEFDSEVAFVGTWMPERGPFLVRILAAGVPLAIWGDHWQKAPQWPQLRKAWRGPAIYGRDYARAVGQAKISLGLLSKGNRDFHTRRSVEVPAIGGLLCGERTGEHEELFRDGEEAIFWQDADECAARCRTLLSDHDRRERIRQAGMRRVREGEFGNEGLVKRVLSHMDLSV